jgi:hypothetical protein
MKGRKFLGILLVVVGSTPFHDNAMIHSVLLIINLCHNICWVLSAFIQGPGEVVACISCLFNVLNKSPISKTASLDAKTHVWPIDGSAQGLTNQRSLLGHRSRQKHETFFDWLQVTKGKQLCIIDTHIILVRVVRNYQISCIKYSTQNQHFAKMIT